MENFKKLLNWYIIIKTKVNCHNDFEHHRHLSKCWRLVAISDPGCSFKIN